MKITCFTIIAGLFLMVLHTGLNAQTKMMVKRGNLDRLTTPPIQEGYKTAKWRFYASDSLPQAGYYFWMNSDGHYYYQYIQLNVNTSGIFYNQCHAGATGTMNPEDSTTLVVLIKSIRQYRQPPDVPKPHPMDKGRNRVFEEWNQGQVKTYRLHFKDRLAPQIAVFYEFAEKFRGPMTSPCPRW